MPQDFLHRFPRLAHSLVPTPFHKLEALSEELGVNICCKRDDLTGFGFGGNKTRKLDFLVAEALSLHATDLVATGGVQSNFCRMAAAYASREGLPCHLVLGGLGAEAARGGNLLLDRLYGARLHFVDSDDWADWEAEAERVSQQLRNMERSPFRIPIGGSTPVGALGYALAFREILDDASRLGVTVGAIVHACSSGGTQAGLLAGRAQAAWTGAVRGIGVAKTGAQLAGDVLTLARATATLLDADVHEGDVHVDDRWAGDAYGTPTREGREAQHLFARLEGLVLDDVYTAKAAAGLIGMCRAGDFTPADTVVFLHTGGSPHVFAGYEGAADPPEA